MRHGGDNANDSEGSVLLNRDAIVAAEGLGLQEFHARGLLGTSNELFHFVLEPADLGLFEFLQAKHLRFIQANLANASDRLFALANRALRIHAELQPPL